MSTETESATPIDSGLAALVTLLRLRGVAADAGQIRHRSGTDKIGAPEVLRCARELVTRVWRAKWYGSTTYPASGSCPGRVKADHPTKWELAYSLA